MTNNDDFNNDDLSRRLSNLGDDLTPIRMPGSAAARKRAAQRSRNQVLSSVVAGVLVVAGVVVFRSGVVPADNTDPVESPSNTPTETLPSSPPPSSPDSIEIPDDALIQADDIWDYNESTPDWRTTGPTHLDLACVPMVNEIPALDRASRDFFWALPDSPEGESVDRGPDNPHLRQDLLLVEPGTGSQAFDQLRQQVIECIPPPQGEFRQNIDMGAVENVGDDAWITRFWDPITPQDPDDQFSRGIVNVGLARQGDLVSVTVNVRFGQDAIEGPDYRTPANAADRMCLAMLGESCVGEAEFVPEADVDHSPPASDPNADPSTDPQAPEQSADGEFTLADNPFLTEDDINPVGYSGTFSENPSHEAHAWVDSWCLDDPSGFDDTVAQTMHWVSDVEGYVSETVIEFPGATTAGSWLTDYTAIEQRCSGLGIEIEKDESMPGVREINQLELTGADTGDEVLGWNLIGDGGPETDGYYAGAGVAVRDNIGVILRFYAMSPPDNWGRYLRDHLGRLALDRAIAD